MKRSGQVLMATVLMLSISAITLGGTITGSRTNRTGTITGSRAGTITGSKTGTITGSGRGIVPTGSSTAQGINERNTLGDDLVARTLLFLLELYM